MKIALFHIVSVAFAVAAPQNIEKRDSPPRKEPSDVPLAPLCSFLKQCPNGQTCVGERQLYKYKQGLCVEKQIECTGTYNSGENTCPKDQKYTCVPRANRKECSKDNPSLESTGGMAHNFDPSPSYCGHCVEASKFAGLRGLQPWLTVDTRCKDDRPSLCFDFFDDKALGACLDENFFRGADICPEWLITNACDENDTCGSGLACVISRCTDNNDPERCGKKICLPENVVSGLPRPPTSATTGCVVTPVIKTITEKETKTETITVTPPGGKPKLTTVIITKTKTIKGPKETVTVTVTTKKPKDPKQNDYNVGY
ncbi:hypothetical protein TWF481_010358 [Arthrobotrys musiformis]|uniref:Uncharacterized protein n=1 Tax=Arthrobotrys musiformis TaxID=47236 RepID=A0AAV9W2Q2_9PEZI